MIRENLPKRQGLSENTMNICLVGNFSGNLDEGMKIVGQCLASELSKAHKVLKLGILETLNPKAIRRLSAFHPNILHYVPGPSPFSFTILRYLSLSQKLAGNLLCKTVMSATQPRLPLNAISFCKRLKPDLMLAQSDSYERYFKGLGFTVQYLPNGVDIDRFKPVENLQKKHLRKKYGLAQDKFVVLHVGPIRANRGLDVMKSVARIQNCTVLVVGGTTSSPERKMFADLVKNGCIVWRKYVQSIHEIYQLSDLYVFPVEDALGCIDMPLSILEAMACNLPVITTRFGAFPRLFAEGDGFRYVENRHQIPQKTEAFIGGGLSPDVQTRMKVLPYSWYNISRTLSQNYHELLRKKN